MKVFKNYNLTALNTFGVPAKAAFFASIYNSGELTGLADLLKNEERMVLGGGSNVLFTRDYPGLIIHNLIKGIHSTEVSETEVLVEAMGGERWHDLVLYCVNHGYSGIENLSLIPGSVGAAPVQNIGAYGVELKDVLLKVKAFSLVDNTQREFEVEECSFGYRNSIFKNLYKGRYFITGIVLKLSRVPTLNISYGSIAAELKKITPGTPTIKSVSDAVISIREKKLPDPLVLGNAGSFFKNPILEHHEFEVLQKEFPDLPFYTYQDKIKIPAAWLIERSGLKGYREGRVGCYPHQPLVIVNYGGATGIEIYDFSEMVIEKVFSRFRVRLQREVNIV